MRHKVDGRKFDRNTKTRKTLFRNLITQFFMHDRIVTTEAKAKEVRRLAEKLITKAKKEDLHARRQVLRVVSDKGAVKRLFDVILAKVSNRNTGGYTRIIKIGNRKGDDAPMALLEILEPGSGRAKTHKALKKKTAGKAKSKTKKEKAKEKVKEKGAAAKAIPRVKETKEEELEQKTVVKEEKPGETPVEATETGSSQETITEEPEASEAQAPTAGEDEMSDDSQSSEKQETDSETESETEKEKKEDS